MITSTGQQIRRDVKTTLHRERKPPTWEDEMRTRVNLHEGERSCVGGGGEELGRRRRGEGWR